MKSRKYKIINRKKRCMVRTADFCLDCAAIFGLIRSRQPRIKLVDNQNDIHKILIIRLAYIGDVVMTQPVIRPLRKAFPNARIDFLTSRAAAPLLQSDPDLDSVIPFDAPWFYGKDRGDDTAELIKQLREQYDLGIDFRGDIRNIWHCLFRPQIKNRLSYISGGGGALLTHPLEWNQLKHKVDFHLDLLRKSGFEAPWTDPVIHLQKDEIDSARKILDQVSSCKEQAPVAIHPGSRMELKCWAPERFQELIGRINTKTDRPVILLEAPGNEELTRKISRTVDIAADYTGQLSLREMAAVLSHCGSLVCHDSAPMHIAAAVGCPVVALFGPSRPIETAPCGPGHRVLESECEFKDSCDESVCIRDGVSGCMDQISVAKVFDALTQTLNM